MSMDWSALSRDKRIPLNTQVTSRTVHSNHSINVCERFLTDEQKAQLNGLKCQSYPLTDFVKQLQNQSTPSIVQSCQRRFGSCAKDMLDMRHKWFIKSVSITQMNTMKKQSKLISSFVHRSNLFNPMNLSTKNIILPINKRSIHC